MKRFFSYYAPYMPIVLAAKFDELAYNPDDIMTWYARLPNLSEIERKPFGSLPSKARLMAMWGYYFWIFYTLAGLAVLSFSPLAGIVAVAIGPFVAGGAMFALPYALWHTISEPKRKAQARLTKKSRSKTSKPKKKKTSGTSKK